MLSTYLFAQPSWKIYMSKTKVLVEKTQGKLNVAIKGLLDIYYDIFAIFSLIPMFIVNSLEGFTCY